MTTTLLYAFVVCGCFSFVAGPLGSLMIWRRLAFLTDTLSHAALLGVALALSFDYPLFVGVIIIDLLIVFFLTTGRYNTFEFMESKLAIFSQVSLAGGLVLFNLIPSTAYQFNQFLFGDILAVTRDDILALSILSAIVWFVVLKYYRAWILSWISEDLAMTHGINPRINYVAILILLTVTISISIKILGALLITALMIIPAMTVRTITSTPKQMMIYATGMGIVSSSIGLISSYYYDIPTTAAITLSAFGLYVIFMIKPVK